MYAYIIFTISLYCLGGSLRVYHINIIDMYKYRMHAYYTHAANLS